MGFRISPDKDDKPIKLVSAEQLRGCAACPLNDDTSLQSPKMLPRGAKQPTVLILGGSPTAVEDASGKHFSGKTGRFLRSFIPEQWQDKIRWSHAINCRTNSGIDANAALTCCRHRFVKDVRETKPGAIFGFGITALLQVLQPDSKYAKIGLWRGRRVPVDIGGHRCWFYPMLDPYEDVLKKRKFEPREGSYGSDNEFAFVLDLKKAFADLDNLPEPVIHTPEQATANIEMVYDIRRVAELLDIVAQDPSTGFDIETNGLRPYITGAKILTMGFSSRSHTFAFPVDHAQADWTILQRKQLDVLIRKFLVEAKCRKVVHNLSFEMEWLGYFYGTECFYSGRWDDSLSQSYLLDARRGSLSLDFQCLQHFGINLKAISGLDRANLDAAPLEEVLLYQGSDARYHRLLFLAQVKRIKQEDLQEVYEHQMRRIPSLVLAQLQGVPVDQKVVQGLRKKYTDRIVEAEQAIADEEVVQEYEKLKDKKFNVNSHIAVGYLFREMLGLKLDSTAKTELAHIEHPIAKKIVYLRETKKALSTYIESVAADGKDTNLFPDGMLHPIISTTTVVTWRTSSANINIQNFTKRDDERKEVRGQIKSSDPNIVVVSIDYAGIQARNVAMESLDKKLIASFRDDYDIHGAWREKIAKKCPKWIPNSVLNDKEAMKGFRHLAKNKFVFPTFFGAQAFNTSEGLGIPQNKAEELREEFFDEFKGIEKWHKKLHKFYYEYGYVTGLSGFKRRAPISGTELINTPIQSDESLIVMDAMRRLSELEDPRYQPAIMVHDDLTFFWPKKEVERRLEVVVNKMIYVPFAWAKVVPLEVEVSVGADWIHQEEIGKFRSDKWNGIVQIS